MDEALRKARYNEVVHVAIEQDEEADISQSNTLHHQICLVPCLNELQGGIQFMNLIDLVQKSVNEKELRFSDQELILRKELQTKQWFFPMLNDHRRNELYWKAIEAVIQHASRKDTQKSTLNAQKPDLNVLDIGCGSGLLSMMIAKYCSNATPSISVHVTAIEMSSAFSFMASQIIKDNHFSESMISIQHGQHSMSPTFNQEIPTQFDVCISELFDDGLLGEGWIPSIRDAWERHLCQNAVVVPCGAQVYASLIQAEWLPKYTGPHPHLFSRLDGSVCRISFSLDSNEGNEYFIDERHVVLPIHAEKLIRDGSLILLSKAIPIFTFDVSSPDSIPGPEGRTKNVPIAVEITKKSDDTDNSNSFVGIAHGVLIWWKMNLWDNRLIYSMEPGKEPWQDHWHPCLHVLDHAINVTHNQTIELEFRHDDNRFFVDLIEPPRSSNINEGHLPIKRIKRDYSENLDYFREESSSTPALISPVRAFQLNDWKRLCVFQRALEYAILFTSRIFKSRKREALSVANSDTITVLDISDFALGGLLVVSMMATNPLDHCHCRVISLENSAGHLPMIAAAISQAKNTCFSGVTLDFEVLQCYNESINLDGIGGTPVSILFSEPYTEVLEGWHIEEALNLFYTIRLLRANGILSDETIVLPASCRILGCIIESGQLRSAFSPCGGRESESICGFKHGYVNRVGCHFHAYDLALPMWQYDFVILSDTFELGNMMYASSNAPQFPEGVSVRAPFHSAGQCDALLVWLEFSFTPSATTFMNGDSAIISTNCQSYNQMIRILDDSARCTIELDKVDKYEVVCKSDFGRHNGLHSHQFNIEINLPPMAPTKRNDT